MMNNPTHTNPKPPILVQLFQFLTKPFILLANFTRHLLLLLLFMLIVYFFVGGHTLTLRDNTALVLAPKGFVVDQFSGDPTSQAIDNIRGTDIPETRVRDLIKAIELATDDDRISALVLNPDYMWGAGLANLREIEYAIDQFRSQSNKPVIAMATNLSQGQYYFASLADEILMDPQGFLFLQGFGSYRNYFKDGLDKLGVDVHLFKVGEYKSAAEPYVRNDMSQAAKEAGLHFMNDLWQTYLEGVAQRRGLAVADLEAIVDQQAQRLMAKNGSVADMAIEAGLVDRIMKRSFMHKRIAEFSSFDDDNNQFRGIGFEDYLNMQLLEEPVWADRVAVVVAEGTILGGEQPAGTIGGASTSNLLELARLDPSVKAVVLRVNSPGGGVYPSEQIRREVDALKVAGKPVVVSMGNVAASGGYWISMTADTIWADEATITGSIGIYGLLMTYPELFNKLGIHSDGVGTTKWVGAFNPDKALDPELAELIQSNIEYGYHQFISSVASARNLEFEMVDRIARGRVWTAKQAHDLGLIDQLGGLQEAVADAASQANLGDDYSLVWVEESLSFTEQLLVDFLATAGEHIDLKSNQQLTMQQLLQPLANELSLILSARPGEVLQVAHCLCDFNYLPR
ncbi:signal peptide peptidase SppA [Marinicella meishanensis]|uniref:signal peptide peptidase SppA n=1 Tax=Marinicella meishanensis TaxID=2873263 RepID=UPI001CBFCD2D|nr:signal peptide peptidase SppA [Marinicella sp. NBU2979]